eukprot:scaffold9310_cov51-Attheya_sp.AAC.1
MRSCIHPHSVPLTPRRNTNNGDNGGNGGGGGSSMAGEWMGAFLWIAMRKAGIEFPSLIPTWGVVVMMDDPTNDTNGHLTNYKEQFQPKTMVGTINGTDHHSFLQNKMVGVVMPLVEFETIKDMTEQEQEPIMDRHYDRPLLPTTPVGLARMMVPTVETLLFVEQMGMSFQDLMPQNIGVPTTTTTSITTTTTTTLAGSVETTQPHGDSFLIYDKSFLSFLEGTTCSILLDPQHERACHFCHTESFPTTTCHHRNVKHRHRSSEYIFRHECRTFTRGIVSLFHSHQSHHRTTPTTTTTTITHDKESFEPLLHNLRARFMKNATCQFVDMVDYLRNFIANEQNDTHHIIKANTTS